MAPMDKEGLIRLTNELYRLSALFPKKDPLRYKMRELGIDILADFIRFANTPPGPATKDLAFSIRRGVTVLEGFFEVVKVQHWVKNEELLQLSAQYDKVKAEVEVRSQAIEKEALIIPEEEAPPPPEEIREEIVREEVTEKPAEKAPETPPAPAIELPQTPSPSSSPLPSQDEIQTGPPKKVLFDPSTLHNKRQQKILKLLQEKREIQIGQLAKDFPEVSRRTLLRDLEKLSQLGVVKKKGSGRGAHYKFQLGKPEEEKAASHPYERYLNIEKDS